MSRNIKNADDLTKESLIYVLLRTGKNQKEDNYLKLLKNNTNTGVKDKINQIRTLLISLNNILTNKEISPIRKELYEIEKQAIHTEETHQFLDNLLDTLKKRQKYRFNDFQDQSYFGIRDIENLFEHYDTDSKYYKPIELSSAFNKNFMEYEIRVDRNKNVSLKQYLEKISPHLLNLFNERQNKVENKQKIQLIIGISFRHITDSSKNYIFCVNSNNILMLKADNPNDIFTKLLDSFLEKYEIEGNTLRNGSNYAFNFVDITNIKFHSFDLVRGSSYIPSLKWISDKKATINPKNLNDNNCFAYSIIAALHHEEVQYNPERINNLKPFLNNYNWNNIEFPVGHKDYSTFEGNNRYCTKHIICII